MAKYISACTVSVADNDLLAFTPVISVGYTTRDSNDGSINNYSSFQMPDFDMNKTAMQLFIEAHKRAHARENIPYTPPKG